MALWPLFGRLLHAAAAAGGSAVECLLTAVFGNAEHRRQVGFSVAVIALSAKMASADGVVVPEEIEAFRRSFHVPPGDEAHVERLFHLAQGDVAGFDSYAARVRALFADEPATLEAVLDGLFLIAAADGWVHERELAFLETVAEILGIDDRAFARISARHIAADEDPYAVLGLSVDADPAERRRRYLELVREYHPDRFVARGLPPEFIRIANQRMAAINTAWARIGGGDGTRVTGGHKARHAFGGGLAPGGGVA